MRGTEQIGNRRLFYIGSRRAVKTLDALAQKPALNAE
jgi:hypothetical protein